MERLGNIGKYEIEEILGTGSTGRLYRVLDPESGGRLALKILLEELQSCTDSRRRFQREIQFLIQMEHPHLVHAVDAGEWMQRPFLVMELLDGDSIKRQLRRRSFTPEEALMIVIQVASAMDYVGQFDLIHRDIKPENILLTREGVAKLTDMGLAKTRTSQNHISAPGTVLGTPQYMSPEQSRGDSGLDCRTDIYGLGATFYHLLSGSPPISGKQLNEVLEKASRSEIEPLRDMMPGLSEAYHSCVEMMMHRYRDERYESFAQLLADLHRLRWGEPTLAIRERKSSTRSSRMARQRRFSFGLIPTDRDMYTGHLVLKLGLLNPAQLRQALEEQETLARTGVRIDLADTICYLGFCSGAKRFELDRARIELEMKSEMDLFFQAVVEHGLCSAEGIEFCRARAASSGRHPSRILVESGWLDIDRGRRARDQQRLARRSAEDDLFLDTAIAARFLKRRQSDQARLIQNNRSLMGQGNDIGHILVERGFLTEEQRRVTLRAIRRHQLLDSDILELIKDQELRYKNKE